jgi:2-polyprenyl-3-methyl-5-hydroxy-6-metoxy-1,4-benzoquinol methylase
MKQTPAYNIVNMDLFNFMPLDCSRVVEVGCMHGDLARVYRSNNLRSEYIGIEIDPEYAKVAERHCTRTIAGNIEELDAKTMNSLFPSDCWVFGDCLEHLRDPWMLLRRIRESIDSDGCLLACIPNAQNWSVQMRLAKGHFFYEDSGLMDRTHIRWFTRITLIEMFKSTGWKIENAISRNLHAPQEEQCLAAIAAMAKMAGFDAAVAVQDATPFQYVFKVKPA